MEKRKENGNERERWGVIPSTAKSMRSKMDSLVTAEVISLY